MAPPPKQTNAMSREELQGIVANLLHEDNRDRFSNQEREAIRQLLNIKHELADLMKIKEPIEELIRHKDEIKELVESKRFTQNVYKIMTAFLKLAGGITAIIAFYFTFVKGGGSPK